MLYNWDGFELESLVFRFQYTHTLVHSLTLHTQTFYKNHFCTKLLYKISHSDYLTRLKLVLRIFFPLLFCFLSWKFFFPLYRVVPPFCAFTDWFFNSKKRDRLHMILWVKWFTRKSKIRKGINFTGFFWQSRHKKLEVKNGPSWLL